MSVTMIKSGIFHFFVVRVEEGYDQYLDKVAYLKKWNNKKRYESDFEKALEDALKNTSAFFKPVVQSKHSSTRFKKDEIIGKEKDSIECVMEDLLDAHDFEGLRRLLHDFGYNVPVTFPNELEVPEEWALLEYDEHLELFFGPPELNDGQTDTDEDLEKRAILYLEDGLRRRDTPFIRVALMAMGFDIPFKEDVPSQAPHLPNGPE